MRMIFFFFSILFITACNDDKRPKSTINEAAVKESCIYEFTDTGALDKVIERKDAYRVCDCVIANAVKLYKSEEEMERDTAGFRKLVFECIDQVRTKLSK